MKKYSYRAFGLNIVSDFELPELVKGNGKNDVEILLGNIEEIDGEFSTNQIFKTDSEEIIYQLKNVAGCRILNGNKAIIMPSPSLSHSTLRLLILTSVLGCILIQRKMSPIHGSSVVIGDSSIIIAGRSGAGKSTLTSTFIEHGYKFLTDDVSVISMDDFGNMYVQPGYPYRKLHKDSADHHSLNIEELERIEYEDEKFLVPVNQYFIDTPKRLLALVEITPMTVDNVSIEKLKGISKLNVLMENLYRGALASHFNSRTYYFERIGDIASKLDVFKMRRPKNQFTCEEQLELILNEVGICPMGGTKNEK